MKNKSKKVKIKSILVNKYSVICNSLLILFCVFAISPFTSFHGDLAQAEDLNPSVQSDETIYPYSKTFTITAYYSPLPCQQKYVTGSYDGDIRLNGHGVHGADGTNVYPGMVAAPKTFPFNTKMYIPDIGVVAVHDRGGAIVSSNTEGVYDRLDIWMGYGDKGLKRALQWGKRTLTVTVYGLNGSMTEQVMLNDYSSEESIPMDCSTSSAVSSQADTTKTTYSTSTIISPSIDTVRNLQIELKNLNFYKAEINGKYDELTEHAVFKFQQSQGIIQDRNSAGAGVFGPKTKNRLNEIVSLRFKNKNLIKKSSEVKSTKQESNISFGNGFPEETLGRILSTELSYGDSGSEVIKLQKFLKNNGFFKGSLITDYFGDKTKQSLIAFQLHYKIISSTSDIGAGRVGPMTLKTINNL